MLTFDELKASNNIIVNRIVQAEREKDINLELKLKKELYSNKLLMIDMITATDKRNGIKAVDFMKLVEEMPHIPRYATGINALDMELLGGLETGLFIQLAGESGVGKTHLFLEIVTNIALGNKSVFFNFEMGKRLLHKRLKKLIAHTIQGENLIIDSDTRNLKDLIMEIELYSQDGIKFFAIDSKMKIEVDGKEDEHLKISRLSNELAKLAQKRDIIILLVNQMNESDIKNNRLAMKGSGDQKYDADIALFYVKDEKENRTLMCTKNRQDEVLFTLKLKLNRDGRTIGINEPEITNYSAEIPNF